MVARRRRAQLQGLVEARETCEQETLRTSEITVKEEQGRPETGDPTKTVVEKVIKGEFSHRA